MRMRTASDKRWRLGVLLAMGIGVLYALPARAHFLLQSPPAYSMQDSLGSPQKSAPCGQADPGQAVMPTNMVTAYVSGGMLTLTIVETVDHPGHYRVAIAKDQASLPADPPVTAASTACGSTVIDANPKLPLLADGVFVHTASFNKVPQTINIKLPDGFTCQNCVLQVAEFMSNHGLNNPGGCFYHHCATVTVDPAPVADMSTQPVADMAMETTPPPAMSEGCSYVSSRAPRFGMLGFASFLLLGLVLRRRREDAIQ